MRLFLIACAVLVAVATGALRVHLGRSETVSRRSASGVPTVVGAPMSYAWLFDNRSGKPVVITRVELVDRDPTLRVLGLLSAPPDRMGVMGMPGFPPHIWRGCRACRPAEGTTAPPGRTWILGGFEAAAPGRSSVRALAVEYVRDFERHREVVPDAFTLCAPAARFIADEDCLVDEDDS